MLARADCHGDFAARTAARYSGLVNQTSHRSRGIMIKNRFSIDDIDFPDQSGIAMRSIGLSFGEGHAEERSRSLTSSVQERPRADILSTRRDADAAAAALSKHFMTTMRLVELATPKTSGGDHTT